MAKLQAALLAVSAVALSGCGIIDWDSPCSTPNCGAPTAVYNPYTGVTTYDYSPPRQEQYVPMTQPYSSSAASAAPETYPPSTFVSIEESGRQQEGASPVTSGGAKVSPQ